MKTKQLKALAKVAKSKTFPVIDGNALIKDGRMYATSFDLTLSYPCDEKGTAVIPVKQLSKMKFDSFSLNENAPTFILHVHKGKGVVTLPCNFKPEDFPMPTEDKEPERLGKISGKTIDAIKSAVHFVCKDELRPPMRGVYLDEENVVATDAHRLAFLKKDKRHVSDLIIPNDAVSCITEDSYTVYRIGDRILLKGKEEHIYFREIDYRFPNWKNVVSDKSRATAHVRVDDLKQAAKDGLAVIDKTSKAAAFIFEAGGLEIIIPDEDKKHSIMKQEIFMGWAVAPETRFVIGLNLQNLMTVLNQIEEPVVEIRLDKENSAVYFNDRFLVMPVCFSLDEGKTADFLEHPTGWHSPYAPENGYLPGDQVFTNLDTSKVKGAFYGYVREYYALVGVEASHDSHAATTFHEVHTSQISYFEEQTEEVEKEETVRFNPHDILILTTKQDEEFVVNFRGYTNKEETKAMVAAPELGGQMEVDVSQLRAREEQEEPGQQPAGEQEQQADAEQPIVDEGKSEDFSDEERHEPSATSAPEQEEEAEPPYIREYSEKAIVVLGDTKPIRKKLRANKGKWIPKGLMIDGEPVTGWIFSKKRLPEVEKIIMG